MSCSFELSIRKVLKPPRAWSCNEVICVPSSLAIISPRKRELVVYCIFALVYLSLFLCVLVRLPFIAVGLILHALTDSSFWFDK